jgi:hypothetical protein
MATKEQIIEHTIIEFNDSGRTSATALRRIIVNNLEKHGFAIKSVCSCAVKGAYEECVVHICKKCDNEQI